MSRDWLDSPVERKSSFLSTTVALAVWLAVIIPSLAAFAFMALMIFMM